MADEDDFDIDIYGDDKPELVPEPADEPKPATPEPTVSAPVPEPHSEQTKQEPESEPAIDPGPPPDGNIGSEAGDVTMKDVQITAGAVGLATADKSKQSSEQPAGDVDPGATTALRVAELQWWTTEDDIRDWASRAGAEDQIDEITFNEHKVNGKSKGEVYIRLQSPAAATAVRRFVANVVSTEQPSVKKISAVFTSPDHNPYKSGKDGGGKTKDNTFGGPRPQHTTAYGRGGGYSGNQNGFRGRGGFDRGGYGNNAGGRGGFANQQGQMMGGYVGGMNGMGMQNHMGNFGRVAGQMGFNRGAMGMGARGGGFQNNRGGRGGPMMGMNGMGMMPNMGMSMIDMSQMGGMGMGMPQMGMGGMGFGGFPQGGSGQQQGFQNDGNPHGAKRARPE